jgi:polyvinyl alcohol dehydrogenase (cytochrome)
MNFRTALPALLLATSLLVACSREAPPAAADAATAQGGAGSPAVADAAAEEQKFDPEKSPGKQVFEQACASCHLGQVAKAPHKMFLQMLSGPTIHESLEKGLMMEQAKALTAEQRVQVAEYLSGGLLAAQQAEIPPAMCTNDAAPFNAAMKPAPVTWGYGNARFAPADVAKLSAADAPKLQLAWAFEFPAGIRARSQPSIAYGSVFVGSFDGHVYALDLGTGCARWVFKAGAEVRTAVVPYEAKGGANVRTQPPRLFFGDVLGRLYSVDARTGKLAWSVKLDDHPNATLTGTGTIHDGVIYQPISSLEVTSAADPAYECCTFRGAVVAVDAWSGELRWKAHSIAEEPREVGKTSIGTKILAPSGAPIWNSPTIDAKRGVLYVGTGENYSSPSNDTSDALLAFRLNDGKLMWSQQMVKGDAWNVACMMKDNPNCPVENGPDVDFGAGTILTTLPSGKDVLLAGQKNGAVYALDVDAKGALLWKTQVGRGGIQGGVHFGMAIEGNTVYVPISDMKDEHDGRPPRPGKPGLYALDVATGAQRWAAPADDVCGTLQFCDAGISAAISAAPGLVFAGHMDGRFRAYDGRSGKVLFEYDAKQEVTTVSGARARGGSFGGAGAAIRDGYVVVNSGYGMYFHMPGNVLLAFTTPTQGSATGN